MVDGLDETAEDVMKILVWDDRPPRDWKRRRRRSTAALPGCKMLYLELECLI
jgi:hypothetical protein